MRPSLPALPLRSRITTDGIDRAPHRAFMRGMGLELSKHEGALAELRDKGLA